MARSLNLFTTPTVELRAAFDTIEHPGFFDLLMHPYNNSLKAVLMVFEQLKAKGGLEEWPDCCNVGPTVYGSGGCYRYFVYKDGRIRFSKGHCHEERVWKKAGRLGFDVS